MQKSKKKIYLISLGCSRNLVDSEVLLGGLKKRGMTVARRPELADYLIVNTCAFIEDSKKESIEKILELAAYKRSGKKLIVTGCMPQRYSKQLAAEIPEIDALFGASDFGKIAEYVDGDLREKVSVTRVPSFLYTGSEPRELMTPGHFAYVKIQEGCINRCSYCAIPDIRGKYRSRKIADILGEVGTLVGRHKVSEINIIGQDTTLYGRDIYGEPRLSQLLSKCARIMKKGWIRLLYTHPAHFSDELIRVIREEPNMCKYIDMPIQHINDRILRLMNRHIGKADIIRLIKKIRKQIPGLALRSSVIVGFPGETMAEFEELLGFVKEIRFERLGAFAYSREEGTPAYGFKDQVPERTKADRLDAIMTAQKGISSESNRKFLGRKLKVMVEGIYDKGESQYQGRSEFDAPEIDGMCIVRSRRALRSGQFVNVRINDTLEYDLVGDVITR